MRLISDPAEIAEFDKHATWVPVVGNDGTNEPEVTTEELRLLKSRQVYLGRI